MGFVIDPMDQGLIGGDMKVCEAAVAEAIRLPVVGGHAMDLREVGTDDAAMRDDHH